MLKENITTTIGVETTKPIVRDISFAYHTKSETEQKCFALDVTFKNVSLRGKQPLLFLSHK